MHRLTRIIATLVIAALAAGCAGATAASAPSVDSTTITAEAEPPSTTTTTAPVVTSTTVSIAPAVSTTVTTAPPAVASADCYADLAREVGWPEETLPHLEFIMRRESGCNPTAFADRPSTLDLSRGLLQINAYGSLDAGVRRLCGIDPATLFDPATNLACGLELWHAMGWAPWGG